MSSGQVQPYLHTGVLARINSQSEGKHSHLCQQFELKKHLEEAHAQAKGLESCG